MTQPPIKFPATALSITADAESLVKESRHRRDTLVQSLTLEKATFSNVVLPLAQMENDFTKSANLLSFYRHISPDRDIRTAISRTVISQEIKKRPTSSFGIMTFTAIAS